GPGLVVEALLLARHCFLSGRRIGELLSKGAQLGLRRLERGALGNGVAPVAEPVDGGIAGLQLEQGVERHRSIRGHSAEVNEWNAGCPASPSAVEAASSRAGTAPATGIRLGRAP